jgi:exodeoxyribonuclease-3
MRIITVNVNGIRAAERKGFFIWLSEQNADFVCLQEIKAQQAQLSDAIFYPENYHCYYHPAEKKGYSGVAIYSRHLPEQVSNSIGWHDIDSEGRFLEVQLGKLSVISLYLPSGSSGEERQGFKFSVLERLNTYLQQRATEGRDMIICGDWNIAHHNIDIENWRGNQKNSGFLPQERQWLTDLLANNWCDAFRVINNEAKQYTWWSNRGQAWAKNVGWRIDYHIISQSLKDKVIAASIYKQQRFSDHAPLIIDYN